MTQKAMPKDFDLSGLEEWGVSRATMGYSSIMGFWDF